MRASAIVAALRARRTGSRSGSSIATYSSASIATRSSIRGGARARGALEISEDSFEKDGRTITFQRLHLTGAPRTPGFSRPVARPPTVKRRKARKEPRAARPRTDDTPGAPPSRLVEMLRAWRKSESQRKGIPAFRVLTDRALMGIAGEQPQTEAALLRLSGMGRSIVQKYGKQILAIVARG